MIDVRHGDCMTVLPTLAAESVHCVVTSPPYYGLRDYGVTGQIGLEPTPDAYVSELVEVFREVRRVLRKDGTCWLNLGDSYASSQTNNSGYSAKSTLGGFTRPDTKGRRANDGATSRKIDSQGKPKDLLMIPSRVALALQADGWWLRSEIVWHKPNPMPESVTDRPTSAHEKVFLLTKSGSTLWWRAKDTREWSQSPDLSETIVNAKGEEVPRWRGFDYWYDADAVAENADSVVVMPGMLGKRGGKDRNDAHDGTGGHSKAVDGATRNLRNVWTITTKPYSEAHFATFPPELAERCIKAGCPSDGTVLDPFAGAGTTGLVADRLDRDALLIELNPEYCTLAADRITQDGPLFAEVQT